MTLRIKFTQEEIDQLNYEPYHYPHPIIQKKMQVLHLKALGFLHKDIAKIAEVTETTARGYMVEYKEGGIEQLKKLGYKREKSALNNHTDVIKEDFSKNPPSTIKEAAARIEKLTGVKRGLTQVGVYLKKTNLNAGRFLKSQQKPTLESKSNFYWML